MELTAFENRVIEAMNQTSGLADPEAWLVEALGGGRSDSGATVNVSTSLGLPPVFGWTSMIAGHMAGMELQLMRQISEVRKELNRQHIAYRLLNHSPNDWQTAFKLRETMQAHALLQGNGRAYISRDGVGKPTELFLLQPWNTYTVVLYGEKFHITYLTPNDPMPADLEARNQGGGMYVIPDEDCLHIFGMSYNGYWGLHLIGILKDALGIGIAGQTMTGSSFKNNGMPGLLIEHPGHRIQNNQQKEAWISDFNRVHRGANNAGRVGMLDAGMKVHQLSMNAQDAQLRELREFSREDLAMAFRLPPDGGSAYKTVTERMTQYKTNCLGPWMQSWSTECYKKLFSLREKQSDTYQWRFDTMELVKGDPNTLAEYTRKMRDQNALNGNEVRILHGFNAESDDVLDDYIAPNLIDNEPEVVEQVPERLNEPPAQTAGNEQAAIRRNFRTLIGWEVRRVKQLAKTKGNFLQEIDAFYDKFENKLEEVCREVNMPGVQAALYCDNSKISIIEVAGCVQQEQLPAMIAQLVDDWENRVEELINV